MKHHYDIPTVELRRPRAALWLAGVGLMLAVFSVRHVWFIVAFRQERVMTVIWLLFFLITGFQWIVSWMERPFTTDESQQEELDRLWVTVCVPIFNEDPEVLDRVLYSLFSQTRLPNKVEVVDDGSKVDYHEIRSWWEERHPPEVEFSWVRQSNTGKKLAQARTFRQVGADIVVTVDSDTVLEQRALAEGLKPFADPRVQSVAGLELAWNHDWNLMTRLNSTRQLVWQLVTCSSQSVIKGNVLVNRGTYALYRGQLIRDVLPGYLGESFWGRPIRLGDDTFLTTLALCRGRAVQQPSAVCLTMYPENLSHHIRQWTRWMRGTTLRTFWRIRYLRVTSWGWLYTIINLWLFLGSLSLTGLFIALWPRSASYAQALVAATIIWSWALGIRMLVVRRSDQTTLARLGAAMLAPAAALWVLAVLRFVRVYGTFTFLQQRWTTRADVEIGANQTSDNPDLQRQAFLTEDPADMVVRDKEEVRDPAPQDTEAEPHQVVVTSRGVPTAAVSGATTSVDTTLFVGPRARDDLVRLNGVTRSRVMIPPVDEEQPEGSGDHFASLISANELDSSRWFEDVP